MPIKFSKHAKEQMKRRKISQKQVIDVMRNSRQKMSSFRERRLRQMRVGGKILEVVTKTEGSRITVITAYFLEE